MKLLFRLQLAIYMVILGVVLTVAPQPLLGQTPEIEGWSNPLLLGNGWWQSIAVDRLNQIHIAWYGGTLQNVPSDTDTKKNNDIMTYRQRSADGVWSEPNDVIYTGIGGYTIRNALAATNDGMIHVVFRGGAQHFFSSAPIIGATDAKNWSKPVDISPVGYYVNMFADKKDVLHIVYSGGSDVGNFRQINQASIELNPCALCSDLFYRRSTDGGKTWEAATPLSLEPDTGSDRPDIFQGPSGRIYIDWDEGYDWYGGRGTPKDVRLAYSDDDGSTWSKPIILDGGALPDRSPIQIRAAEMLDGSLLAVWRYSNYLDRNIYYQISKDVGKTWTEPTPIPGIFNRSINDTPLDDYEIKIDHLGSLHLFAVGVLDPETTTTASLYHMEYRDGNWLQPQRVFFNPQMRPEWPKAVIGNQNDIHLSWFIRIRNPDGTDGLQVFYSTLKGNLGQAAVSTFLPTASSMPTATAFQNFIPTKTPFPTVTLKDDNGGVPNTDNYATQTVLGGLLSVGIFCLVVSLIYRFIIRK